MQLTDFFKGMFGGIGQGFTNLLLFFFKQKLFTMFGVIAFTATIIEAFISAYTLVPDHNVFRIILFTIWNVAKVCLFIDNQLYLLSREFSTMLMPTFFDSVKYAFLIFKNLFFYIMWWKIAVKLFQKDIGQVNIIQEIAPKFIIFFIVMNFIGLFATGVIHKYESENALTPFQNIKFQMDNNFESAFDFLWKLYPFKGLTHVLMVSGYKMVQAFSGESEILINQSINMSGTY